MNLTELIESEIYEKTPPGSLIKGIATAHCTFGIILDIGMDDIIGIIDFIEFSDEGNMNYTLYPRLGTQIEAVVLGYNMSHQLKLSLRPSQLKKAYKHFNHGFPETVGINTRRHKIIERFPINAIVKGNVFMLNPSDVTINFTSFGILGNIDFTEFLDEGKMDYEFYPILNTEIEAVVIGYANDDQIRLSAKPSLLKKAREEKLR